MDPLIKNWEHRLSWFRSYNEIHNSSKPEAVVQRCSNSQENICARVSFLIKRLWHRCFSVNFMKFLRTPFFMEDLWWLLLQSKKHIRDRFPNNRFFSISWQTKSYIKKKIINLNSSKASQESDILTKIIKQNINYLRVYYTLFLIVACKIPSSYHFWKQVT